MWILCNFHYVQKLLRISYIFIYIYIYIYIYTFNNEIAEFIDLITHQISFRFNLYVLNKTRENTKYSTLNKSLTWSYLQYPL